MGSLKAKIEQQCDHLLGEIWIYWNEKKKIGPQRLAKPWTYKFHHRVALPHHKTWKTLEFHLCSVEAAVCSSYVICCFRVNLRVWVRVSFELQKKEEPLRRLRARVSRRRGNKEPHQRRSAFTCVNVLLDPSVTRDCGSSVAPTQQKHDKNLRISDLARCLCSAVKKEPQFELSAIKLMICWTCSKGCRNKAVCCQWCLWHHKGTDF